MVVVHDTVNGPKRPRHPEKAHRPDTVLPKKPAWIRVKAPIGHGYAKTRDIVREHHLHTVCEEAGCPNIGECWEKAHATMMIMGDTCTRACAFCNVKTGLPGPLDAEEPENVARAVEKLGLAHVVITSVDRDDLEDGGAAHFAATATEQFLEQLAKVPIDLLESKPEALARATLDFAQGFVGRVDSGDDILALGSQEQQPLFGFRQLFQSHHVYGAKTLQSGA